MIPAYSELYVKNARETVGVIFDYTINYCKMTPIFASKVFLQSIMTKLIEEGNPAILAGMSNEECAFLLVNSVVKNTKFDIYHTKYEKSKEYWAGALLAATQHATGKTFKEIFDHISFRQIVELYDDCHQMDLLLAIEELKKYLVKEETVTNLRMYRERKGLSQSQLAEKANVKLRMIQLYEQRVNDIDNASASTLKKLSIALECQIEDLLEKEY